MVRGDGVRPAPASADFKNGEGSPAGIATTVASAARHGDGDGDGDGDPPPSSLASSLATLTAAVALNASAAANARHRPRERVSVGAIVRERARRGAASADVERLAHANLERLGAPREPRGDVPEPSGSRRGARGDRARHGGRRIRFET